MFQCRNVKKEYHETTLLDLHRYVDIKIIFRFSNNACVCVFVFRTYARRSDEIRHDFSSRAKRSNELITKTKKKISSIHKNRSFICRSTRARAFIEYTIISSFFFFYPFFIPIRTIISFVQTIIQYYCENLSHCVCRRRNNDITIFYVQTIPHKIFLIFLK